MCMQPTVRLEDHIFFRVRLEPDLTKEKRERSLSQISASPEFLLTKAAKEQCLLLQNLSTVGGITETEL